MDAVFVGQFIGKNTVGSVAVAYIVILINQGVFALIGTDIHSTFDCTWQKKLVFAFQRALSVTFYFNGRPVLYFIGARGEILDLVATQ